MTFIVMFPGAIARAVDDPRAIPRAQIAFSPRDRSLTRRFMRQVSESVRPRALRFYDV